jgi:hypothetical protein
MIGIFRALAESCRRFFARRAARRLGALGLPKGLPPAPAQPLQTSLREPPPFEPPAGEYWTMPLAARALRGLPPGRLFRLAALPPLQPRLDVLRQPPALVLPRAPSLPRLLQLVRPLTSPVRELGVLREPPALMLPRAPRLPVRLELRPPLASAVRDLGVASPALFRLDEELRLPIERDPLRVSSDAPALARPRSFRPRQPLARAPLSRLDPRAWRLDPRTFSPANENATGQKEPYGGLWWVSPRLRREKVDLPWMAQGRLGFISPRTAEWFALWFDQTSRRSPGAREAVEIKQASEIYWAMEECKEQMLIRRDVEKDENAPPLQEFFIIAQEVPMQSHQPEDLGALIPKKQWVEVSRPVPPPPLWARPPHEAYLQWRSLMDGLEER